LSRARRSGAPRTFDPLEVEVFGHLFGSLCEEMGAVLQCSAFSPNIVERRDYSCALFDGAGRLVAQAAHLPVHLGAARASVEAVRTVVGADGFTRGEAWLLNDPFSGGSHLPDLTLVAPIHLERESGAPDYFVVNRAHHADIGGPFPGSMGPAVDIYSEGLRIPPLRMFVGGRPDPRLLDLFLANVRVPDERRGDLLAQYAALVAGERRLRALTDEYGAAALADRARDQISWTAQLATEAVRALADGTTSATDHIALAASGDEVALHATCRVAGARLTVDLRGCDDQVAAPLNAPRAVAEAALFYVLRLLLPEGTPTNHGVLAPLELVTRPGSIVDALPPAAVAAGNVETSQRLVDLLLAALGPASRAGLPAASCGSMSNLAFGAGLGARRAFTHYETHGGGAGAGPSGPGESGVHCHMTNTRNTPVESLERSLPVRVLRSTLVRGSGGSGAQRGGDGIVRELEFDEPVRLSWLSGRGERGAAGARGGEAARGVGGAWVRSGEGAARRRLAAQDSVELQRGARVEVRTPGGGGFGASN
jgi:N-methylhydantoinase B